MPGDIFQYDDRVVDNEARGDGQGHQRQIVEGEMQQVHDPDRAEQGYGHGNAWDQDRSAIQQKKGGHGDNEHGRESHGSFDVRE